MFLNMFLNMFKSKHVFMFFLREERTSVHRLNEELPGMAYVDN